VYGPATLRDRGTTWPGRPRCCQAPVLGGPALAIGAFSKNKRTVLAFSKAAPGIANYNHLRLATSSAVHQALASGQPAAATIAALPGELKSILQNGDNPHGPPPKITQVWEETQHDRSETAGPGTTGLAGSGSHAGARCVWQQLNVEHA